MVFACKVEKLVLDLPAGSLILVQHKSGRLFMQHISACNPAKEQAATGRRI
jgi:hypothetical protein